MKATLKGYRVSAQKARLVADQIRGKGVEDALGLLSLSDKRFARPLAKLLRSAVANAQEKNEREKAGIDIDNLFVETVMVDEGPRAWRIMSRAQGRAAWIARRSAHVTISLGER
ncbi:MAG: 50S ribosomal protein L22 [Deltaproteobacteria bacterium]|nr:50S ribosomal protein L22 [Deltaproteobacteria bacterium]